MTSYGSASRIAILGFASGVAVVSLGMVVDRWWKENRSAGRAQRKRGSDPRSVAGQAEAQSQKVEVSVRRRDPRTTRDAPVPPWQAIAVLKEGNRRYADSSNMWARAPIGIAGREALMQHGQRPTAIILSCADSRVPSDLVFDAQPGDLFILKNAGNTLVKAEGSVVGSIEYAIAHLQVKLILVLGHTHCNIIDGAIKVMMKNKKQIMNNETMAKQNALERFLDALAPIALDTADQLPVGASQQKIAAKMVEVNVFHSMANVLGYSALIRKMVKSGDVEVHGAIHDVVTGKVDFLGVHPKQHGLLSGAPLDVNNVMKTPRTVYGLDVKEIKRPRKIPMPEGDAKKDASPKDGSPEEIKSLRNAHKPDGGAEEMRPKEITSPRDISKPIPDADANRFTIHTARASPKNGRSPRKHPMPRLDLKDMNTKELEQIVA